MRGEWTFVIFTAFVARLTIIFRTHELGHDCWNERGGTLTIENWLPCFTNCIEINWAVNYQERKDVKQDGPKASRAWIFCKLQSESQVQLSVVIHRKYLKGAFCSCSTTKLICVTRESWNGNHILVSLFTGSHSSHSTNVCNARWNHEMEMFFFMISSFAFLSFEMHSSKLLNLNSVLLWNYCKTFIRGL